jgi:signal peptidase I
MQPTPVVEDSFGKKIWLFILDTGQTMLFAGIIFAIIYFFLFRPFQVSGESMYSTYENREYILTNIIGQWFDSPKRGDVIVFKAPEDPDKDFIKRVIAMPGDTFYLKDGAVYVNNKKLDETYLNQGVKTFGGAYIKENKKYTVPQGEFLVMGDNRTNSSDSREWGYLKKDHIIGTSFLVYWPLNHFRVIKNPTN